MKPCEIRRLISVRVTTIKNNNSRNKRFKLKHVGHLQIDQILVGCSSLCFVWFGFQVFLDFLC